MVAATLEATGSRMSAVNIAEFVAKIQENQPNIRKIDKLLSDLPIEVAAHDRDQAIATGLLRAATGHLGLSLGDRACLALAQREQACILTADQPWLDLATPLGLDIRCIRPARQ